MVKKIYCFYLLYVFYGFAYGQSVSSNSFNIQNVHDLKEFFSYTKDRIPLICGHRGGAAKGLPENSIATFEHTLSLYPVFFEVDPRLTKDSVVVVLHDATLNRTTTGSGKLADYTYEEIQTLFLKDTEGEETSYKIHTLDEVIQWAKGKTVLMLDKKDVPLTMLYDIIEKNQAESHVIVSVYSLDEANFYHSRNKDLILEAFITSEKRLKLYDDSDILWSNIVAYVSQPKSTTLYDEIHKRGAMVMAYTGPVYDKISQPSKRKKAYREIVNNGADILLTDRPIEAAQAIRSLWPKISSKSKFFSK